MDFMNRLRTKFYQFMQGRYGTDQLNRTLIIAAIAITIFGMITGIRFLVLAADALLILSFFRMFSRDRAQRAAENQKYLTKTWKIRKAVSEWMNRMKNRKQYRYFTCPKCKERLRVPRGKGKVTITCRKCGEKFEGKA